MIKSLPSTREQLLEADNTITFSTNTDGTVLCTATGWKSPAWNGSAWYMESFPGEEPHRPDMGDWRGNHEIVFQPTMAVSELTTKFIPSGRYANHTWRTVAFPIAAISDVKRHEWFVPDVYGGRD